MRSRSGRSPHRPRIQFCGHGDPLPFSKFVRRPERSRPSPSIFHCFSSLPPEIQLKIYAACDPPTLFQLMKASSWIRADASKCFWSLDNVWYQFPATYLYDSKLSFTSSLHCPVAAKFLTQVEFHLSDLKATFARFLDTSKTQPGAQNLEQASREFWRAFVKCFPSAKRVLFSGIPDNSAKVKTDPVRSLVKTCPPHISLLMAVSPSRKRHYWSFMKINTDGTLQLAKWTWTWDRVKMPMATGPVGAIQEMHQRSIKLLLEMDGVKRMRLLIEQQESTDLELKEWHEARKKQHLKQEVQYKRSWEELQEEWDALRLDMGSPGSSKRQRFEESFVAALKEDPLLEFPGCPSKSWEWKAIQQDLPNPFKKDKSR